MKAPVEYKPEKVVRKVTSEDDPKRQLAHLFVIRTYPGIGFICATDSSSLVMIPVKLEVTDVADGAVPPEAFKSARKAYEDAQEGMLELSLEPGKVHLKTKTLEALWDRFNYLTFPDPTKVLPKTKVRAYIGLSASKLKALADAMASDQVVLEIRSSHEGIVVRPNNHSQQAIGLLMPCSIDKEMMNKTGELFAREAEGNGNAG